MHKCPANNDQFTTYVNEQWNIAMNALTTFGHVAELPTVGLFVKTIGRSWSEDSSQPNK